MSYASITENKLKTPFSYRYSSIDIILIKFLQFYRVFTVPFLSFLHFIEKFHISYSQIGLQTISFFYLLNDEILQKFQDVNIKNFKFEKK